MVRKVQVLVNLVEKVAERVLSEGSEVPVRGEDQQLSKTDKKQKQW